MDSQTLAVTWLGCPSMQLSDTGLCMWLTVLLVASYVAKGWECYLHASYKSLYMVVNVYKTKY